MVVVLLHKSISRVTHGMELRTPYLELLMGRIFMQNTALVTHAWGGTMQNMFCINPSSYTHYTFMGRIYPKVDKSTHVYLTRFL